MKYFLLLFLFPLFSNAQKVEQFCKASIENKMFSGGKKLLHVNYGEKFGVYTADSLGREIVFESDIDALNYLGRSGWKLVEIITTNSSVSGSGGQYFIFKKEIELSELKMQLANRKITTDN